MALRLGCQVDPYLATLPASSFGAVVKRQSDGLWFTGTGFAAPVAASPITVFPLAWDAVPGILTGLVPTTHNRFMARRLVSDLVRAHLRDATARACAAGNLAHHHDERR